MATGSAQAGEHLQRQLEEAQTALAAVRQHQAGKVDLKEAWKAIQKVKVFVTLNPLGNIADPSLLKAVALIGRECFELAALLSVAEMQEQLHRLEGGAAGMVDEPLEGEEDFERHMLMLLPYYTDYADLVPPSQHHGELLCLYLLYFLACNRIGEFHMALQLLAPQVHSDPLVAEVLALEQHLIEGSYGFISDLQRAQRQDASGSRMKLGTSLPSAHVFIEKLVKTVRLKAAASLERSHDWVDIQYALQTLNLKNVQELQAFVEVHNLGKRREKAMPDFLGGGMNGNASAPAQSALYHAQGGVGAAGSVSTLAAGVGSGSFAAAVSFCASGEVEVEWAIEGNLLKFRKSGGEKIQTPQHCSTQALNVIGNLIEYATELERIV
uniref:26S proteasome non-ATPase regulatory subunit RPN12A n=1 Tax=Neospora caninum (strain Liverpool) TaxID=572307 RepID=A0A0F7ULI2_NEOCL|nr:TPA: 26S proteasome non-ATPase regulatory subunit RPN12A [Neospora caninum Liverpool]